MMEQNATHPNETETPRYDPVDCVEIEKLIVDDLGCGSPQDARYQVGRMELRIRQLETELNAARAEAQRLLGVDAKLKDALLENERLKRDVAKAVADFDYGIGRCGSLWGRLKVIDITPAMAEGGQE